MTHRFSDVLAQALYLFCVHRLGGRRLLRWIVFEILVPGAFLGAFAVYVVVQRKRLWDRDDRMPLYQGWPNYSQPLTVGGQPVPAFGPDTLEEGTQLWVAHSAAVSSAVFTRFVIRLMALTGLPGQVVRNWTESDGVSGADRMKQLLARIPGDSSWALWRDWQVATNQGYAAISLDACSPTECNWTFFSQDVPYDVGRFESTNDWDPSYNSFRFFHTGTLSLQIQAQRALAFALNESAGGESDIRLTRFAAPNGPLTQDTVVKTAITSDYILSSYGFFTVLAFAAAFAQMVVSLCHNRQSGVETYLRVNGMSTSAYYLAFSTAHLVMRIPLVPIITVFTKLYLLPDISFAEVFFFILLYLTGLVPMAILTSFCFTNTTLALVGSLAGYLGAAVLGLVSSGCGQQLLTSGICFRAWEATGLVLPVAAAVGLSTMCNKQLTIYNNGGQVNEGPESSYTVAVIVFDFILYAALSWYAGGVAVRGYHPLFLFTRRYWLPPPEEAPNSLRGVEALDLASKRGVSGVTMRIPRGTTFALLGHNGAGKTTMLRLLTGQLEPTRGEVRVAGVRPLRACNLGIVGYCPQVDMLPTQVSCSELLRIIAVFRGVPLRETAACADRAAADLGLYDVRRSLASTLPLGQRRKLCVAAALLNSPDVVMLDEPTAGLDLRSRRQVWDLLRKHRGTQTCIFTTHLLDEADLLGDRIGMMQQGLICPGFQGSTAELRERFRCGYRLDIVKKSSEVSSQRIVDAVLGRIPAALQPAFSAGAARHSRMKRVAGSSGGRELVLPLPRVPDGLRQYVDVLRLLQQDDVAAELEIESFALGMMGLDEVFSRLEGSSWLGLSSTPSRSNITFSSELSSADSHRAAQAAVGRMTRSDSANSAPVAPDAALTVPLLSGPAAPGEPDRIPDLIMQRATFRSVPGQIWVILAQKKLPSTFNLHNKGFYAFQVIVPILFVLIACSFTNTSPDRQAVPGYSDTLRVPLDAGAVWESRPAPVYVGGSDSALVQATLGALRAADAAAGWAFSEFSGRFADFGTTRAPSAPLALEVFPGGALNVWFNSTCTYAGPVAADMLLDAASYSTGGVRSATTLAQFPGDSYWYRLIPPWVAYGTLVAAALSILTGMFSGVLVSERANGLRHLQKMCGVHDTVFYVACGLADWLACFVVELVLLGVIAAWKTWMRFDRFLVLALLCLLYTPAILACHYCFSHILSTRSPTLTVALATAGHTLVTFWALVMVATSRDENREWTRGFWLWVEPTYAVVQGLMYFDNFLGDAASDVLDHPDRTPLGAMSENCVRLVCQLAIWAFLLVVCESGYKVVNLVRKLFPRPAGYYAREASLAGVEQTPSVRNEARRVERETERKSSIDPACVYVKQLRKVYSRTPALSGLYLRLAPGDCLGLLSPSGAGKSTALRMVAGLMAPTQGEVVTHGLSNLYPLQLKSLMQLIGYCPQSDPLPPHLTVRQTLTFFAELKGLPAAGESGSVERLAVRLGLFDHLNYRCAQLSGGAKRLVTLAVSLLGSPPIILLDEPTSQMDPSACRRAWGLLTQLLEHGGQETAPILVLATHSLREADAVCNRIAVLQRGHLSALGTPKELKDHFAGGYFLRVSQSEPRLGRQLHDAILRSVPKAQLVERHGKGVQYQMPLTVPLADLVETLESGREQLAIDEFYLSRLSFEQAYLRTVERQGHVQRGGLSESGAVPPLRVVILICGTRGDVQPFLALSEGLRAAGHTVRIATHACFRKWVTETGFDFADIGGDPERLMQFMVEHPTMITVNIDHIKEQRATLAEIYRGCWDACATWAPDVIIANPPVQVHVHIAEKLHVPVQIHFTMPWSPTKAYLHPLAAFGIVSNEQSYWIVEEVQWLGLSDVINDFRTRTLGLPKMRNGSGIQHKVMAPHVYCVSESLVPRPTDWGDHIAIAGFWFLDSLARGYEPPPDLAAFLASGPPPVYIGFGSIVVQDPRALEAAVFGALRILAPEGVRAIVSPGWARLGHGMDLPPNIFLLERCPHDWLFPRCAAVVHHGGAGTTATGLRAGCPTVVVPFFGDQPFWGQCCAREGVGPPPIPHKTLTEQNLADGLRFALSPAARAQARELGERIDAEPGVRNGVAAFHRFLPLDATCSWEVDCWENQRWFPGVGWTATLALGDPSVFSDHSGLLSRDRERFPCPDGWTWEADWEVDLSHAACDADGFVYSATFRGPWHGHPGHSDFVRRRRWFRRRGRSGAVAAAQSLQNELSHLRRENARLRERLRWTTAQLRQMMVVSSRGPSQAGLGIDADSLGPRSVSQHAAPVEDSPCAEEPWVRDSLGNRNQSQDLRRSLRGAPAGASCWSPSAGATHLHHAVDGGCVHVAQILVDHCGADPDAQDAAGVTPLGIARENSSWMDPDGELSRRLEQRRRQGRGSLSLTENAGAVHPASAPAAGDFALPHPRLHSLHEMTPVSERPPSRQGAEGRLR